jgi:hypothetical protein
VFDFKTEGWASPAGHRPIPVGLSAHPKTSLRTRQPRPPDLFRISFRGCRTTSDQHVLNWLVKALPPEQNQNSKVIVYTLKVEDQKGTEHITRLLKLDLVGLDVKYYGALRNFYQGVKSGDEQQIVVQPGA